MRRGGSCLAAVEDLLRDGAARSTLSSHFVFSSHSVPDLIRSNFFRTDETDTKSNFSDTTLGASEEDGDEPHPGGDGPNLPL